MEILTEKLVLTCKVLQNRIECEIKDRESDIPIGNITLDEGKRAIQVEHPRRWTASSFEHFLRGPILPAEESE